MSSKLRQRCTTVSICLIIIILVALIATVWIMLGQGAFKANNKSHKPTPTTTITTTTTSNSSSISSTVRKKEYVDLSHLDDLDGTVEFVKPLKISPVPLHDHDIIFDQIRKTNEGPPLRHHSGHFRHKQAEIWDPHPQYVIDAFGRTLYLELEYNARFVDPNLHISHVFDNYTHRTRHDPKMIGCYYTGKIRNEQDSDVSVSLCNGMTGYIRTADSNYFIEPAEKSANLEESGSFLHRIKKIPHLPNNNNEVVDLSSLSSDLCETNDNRTIIEDDFVSEMVAMPSPSSIKHTINKRHIDDDDDDDDIWMEPEGSRMPREVTWPTNTYDDNNNGDSGDSNEYFVKVLVVADQTMINYYQNDDELKTYILTLMAHVALLFRDASIGLSISLSVVNIWMLNDTVFTNKDSQVMLRKFCEWQHYNAPDRFHDVALLLTRDLICRKNSTHSCRTIGVAQVESVCNPTSSCAIVRDRGLSSSYTIAHEIGHVLGMPHDKGSGFIMTRVLSNDTKPWLWSEDSKQFVAEFLESGKATCLTKAPSQNFISTNFVEILPGEVFQANRQCELEFGTGFKQCIMENQPPCAFLWCTSSEKVGCTTEHVLWADGTPCGNYSWCHHGQCIPMDRRQLTPIAGGWGPWQAWSECSRSCGGGIKKSKRLCDSPVPQNGGPYCNGRSFQYQSCNTQSCDKDLPDFREKQCAQYNGNTMNLLNLTRDVQWIPKYGLNDRDELCKLYCRPKNSNAYYLLKKKVIDGTKCGLNSFDICVNGMCLPGGCDNKLDSDIALDDCGVCGGDNSKCQEIVGNYNLSVSGYSKVLRIPKGSSNLDIRQNANNDTNYLVLVDGETGDFVLNSKTMIAPQQKEVIFGGVVISYSGSSAPIERITTPKNHKLQKDLVLGVLAVGKPLRPAITYRYIINQDNAPRYGWRLYRKHDWTKCNSICSGTQFMHPVCVELATNKEQPDSYCSDSDKQHLIQKQDCNTHCQLRWNDVSRGACSVNCGKGIRNVFYNCIKINTGKELYGVVPQQIVDEKHCSILPKPPAFETCYGRCEATRWEYSEWSECSVTCGGGTQRRSAKCIDATNREIADSNCPPSEKITEQRCHYQKCPVWTSRDWTPCSVTCGRGFRTKPYYCHVDGRLYNPAACDPRQRREEKEECFERPCASWSVGIWSQCSTTCGDGVQTRNVICKDLDDDHQLTDETYCLDILKPNESRFCTNPTPCEKLPPPLRYEKHHNDDVDDDIVDNSITYNDSSFKWITGAWSQCSKSCNTGTSSRAVVCRNHFGDEDERFCDRYSRPIATIECNQHSCPTWNYGDWTQCDSNCEKHRLVSCRNATGSYVVGSECNDIDKPTSTAKCKLSQCPYLTRKLPKDYFDSKEKNRRRFKWKIGKWKQCSNTCGRGTRPRQIECEDTLNEVTLVDQYCSHLRRPKTTKPCERFSCNYAWIESNWAECSEMCGPGVRRRNVTCHRVHQGGIVDPTPLPDLLNDNSKIHHKNYCDLYNKPAEVGNCLLSRCDDVFVWRTEPWRQCSQTCGRKGRQTRQIYCMNQRTGQKVQKYQCPKNLRPRRKRPCNQWRCLHSSCKEIQHYTKTRINQDYLITLHNKPVLIYCYKMDTPEPAEYITLPNDSPNFAENYNKRLKNPHSCPINGQRSDTCDCLEVGDERSGVTMFWKVRLNITSLQIIGDDFTFSRQNYGTAVPYGTAGDCYSAVEGCAQARFSIDLTGTSFKISPRVKWRNIGKYATSLFDTNENRVMGRCGGYCGNCVPDPTIGLEVEIT